MFSICLLLLVFITKDCCSQDEEGPYRGKYIGRLNSYHHQVSGEVYAVDEWTIVLVNFNYDGMGDDTFFWAGDSGRPGPQGFIVPDQHGKTNILERYYNEDVRLTLPEGKRVSRIKWLAVYDIDSQNTFGDVYIPDEFSAPAVQAIGPLAGTNAVSSGPVQFLDASTLLIPEFRYDGGGEEVYFWTGVGPQPSSRGFKIPDEDGYLEPIRAYKGEELRLELPGGKTAFEVNWLAVWDAGAQRALASVLVPEGLNVPPSVLATHPYKSSLPRCKQLHRDYQVSWEVFGNQITIELAAQMDEGEYMAWGVSGAEGRSAMLGADVAVAHFDAVQQRGFATDYNITAMAPCVQVLGQWQGVCRDERLQGLDSNQVFTAAREGGLTRVTYRRQLEPSEPMDRAWPVDREVFAVWAVGRLDHAVEPAFHRLFPRADTRLHLAREPALSDCFAFTIGTRAAPAPWETAELFDPSLRVFQVRVGPSGGHRGLRGRPHRPAAAPALALYVNGQLAPDLQLRRGLVYTFKVFGGNDPHSANEYHPLIVTAEPVGGLERLEEGAQRAAKVLAGVQYTRRGRLSPTAAGPLCLGRHPPGADRRRDDDFATFRAFNRTLVWECAEGAPAQLTVAPNTTWPDIVYYHSFTHAGMGGRIYVVDRHKRNIGRKSGAHAHARPPRPLALALAALLASLASLAALAPRH
ncbi:hypothetical protein K1T71_013435 [Dendrolimus kikuchii]|uniref:Uncharacterized protein n=1 Tax=Dendrolimus kikuchii TaxID=765133 RepID=A0ACC1CGF3_9NEOP|nr:hypothetical protein K1T71_013435 [Dendrolimus kikuchii]